MHTTLINLYGAPCSGKSVKMMQLAVHAKLRGIFCEIAAEVAKEYIVQQIPITREIQLQLSAEQLRRLSCFVGHTHAVITDAPVLIGAFYARYRQMPAADEIESLFRQQANALHARAHRVVNVYLWRDHPYDTLGRLESESEDQLIAQQMWAFVQSHSLTEPLLQARSSDSPQSLWDRILAAAT